LKSSRIGTKSQMNSGCLPPCYLGGDIETQLLLPTRTPKPRLYFLSAPDKTFIGRVERGFDFLGYHLAPGRLTLARATVERFVERAHRLYEQERRRPDGFPQLGAYTRRWVRWTSAGVGTFLIKPASLGSNGNS
jgi:hypothetical protein